MRKISLIAGGVLAGLALISRRRTKRANLPVRKNLSRWQEQLLPFNGHAWRAKAPTWAVPLVDQAAQQTGVPAMLLAALIWTESRWQPYVVSPAGALGLAQLMPATAAELGVDPMNPTENVLGEARYLRQQLDAFDDLALACAAYNAGPHRVRQYGGVPPFAETQAYVARILERLAA